MCMIADVFQQNQCILFIVPFFAMEKCVITGISNPASGIRETR